MEYQKLLKKIEMLAEAETLDDQEDEIALIQFYGSKLLGESFEDTEDYEGSFNTRPGRVKWEGEDTEKQGGIDSTEPCEVVKEPKKTILSKNRGPYVANSAFLRNQFHTSMVNLITSEAEKKREAFRLKAEGKKMLTQTRNKNKYNTELLDGFMVRLEKDIRRRKEKELVRAIERVQLNNPQHSIRVSPSKSKEKLRSKADYANKTSTQMHTQRQRRERELLELRKIKRLQEQKRNLSHHPHLRSNYTEIPRQDLLSKVNKIIRVSGNQLNQALE